MLGKMSRQGVSKDIAYQIFIIGTLFFIFGFITWVNGSLIAYLKIACELTNTQSYLVATAFFISYFVMAFPSSYVLSRIGYKKAMAGGLVVMAIGTLTFIPAAYMRAYPIFLLGLFVTGTGLALLQTAANPYVTILGPVESAARRISIMGLCNKAAGAVGTFIFSSILFKDLNGFESGLSQLSASVRATKLDQLASRVIAPYSYLTAGLLVLALMVWFSGLPEIAPEVVEGKTNTSRGGIFRYPNLVLGVIALFLYVGAEVVAGDSIINFGRSQHISLDVSKYFTILTLLAMTVGYIVGILLIPKYVSQAVALETSAVLGFALTLLVVLNTGSLAVGFLALLGLANAVMWPAIWPLALQGLGKLREQGAALLIMAIAGGAVLPPLVGLVFDAHKDKTQLAYLLLVPCYLFILYYARYGHRKKTW